MLNNKTEIMKHRLQFHANRSRRNLQLVLKNLRTFLLLVANLVSMLLYLSSFIQTYFFLFYLITLIKMLILHPF